LHNFKIHTTYTHIHNQSIKQYAIRDENKHDRIYLLTGRAALLSILDYLSCNYAFWVVMNAVAGSPNTRILAREKLHAQIEKFNQEWLRIMCLHCS
jgi:hypothetical protein